MIILGYIGAVLMGFTLGLIGGGGSILSVPIFVYLFSIKPELATGYSLFVVGLSALVGAINYIKERKVDLRTGVVFSIPAFIGVYFARKTIIPSLPNSFIEIGSFELTKDTLIMIVFALMMLLASFSMIRGKTYAPKKNERSIAFYYGIIAIEGIFVGLLTGFVGAGGGFLIIPALVILAGLEMKIAVGTSLLIIAIKSLFGFLGELQVASFIDWSFLLLFSLISFFGIFLGTFASKKISGKNLKPVFGWFVLVMGALILLKEIFYGN